MKRNQVAMMMGTVFMLSTVLSGCGADSSTDTGKNGAQSTAVSEDKTPFPLTLVVNQVGEVPAKDNDIEKAIKAYTNTNLQIQWIPASAYDEKVNVMIASGELPKLIKLNYNNPSMISSLKSDLFWEIGPYLKDYKNLQAQNKLFYDNIAVDGKIYGVPLYRDLGRAVIHYRKDWLDALHLQSPKTLDDWYNVIKALTLNDPDKNGKNDTYGMMLEKKYNQDVSSTLTRISVSQGGPTKWKVEKGVFTPEFVTEPFFETMKLFKRLYDEKLINQDFPVVDTTEVDKAYESGRAGIRISGGNAQSWQDKIVKVVPSAVIEAAAVEGANGRRVPGESGNAGFLAIPKSSVKTEAEFKKVLSFVDKLLDPQMANLIVKGVEGKHYADKGEFTEPLDRDADLKEVKPYRDTLPQRGESYNVAKAMKQPDLFRRSQQIGQSNEQFIVPNPALTLNSDTFSERGKELEQMITDAETKFIMGKIDEAGWKAEIEKWKTAGGNKMIQEYQESYAQSQKK
ncbi:extracellular solute-binding protein [Paenibacillus aceris]|uniref:Aldouronate transport system substrate-binding protein n=1 Tax=Paenibacillus aceris TaxID=869555 RepID=A0ABS4I3Z1_9BACL|nr:extracellular solute-binding protein [Paenibacillus aceris]MBP1965450.1 putative aldouronate transport system substrate-binding protein [Paenibacillus aceris]NHW33499.1 extracellular solute-binding protein [Paenibacillus aceris]